MPRIVPSLALVVAAACASVPRESPPRLAGTVPLQITLRGSLYTGTAALGDALSGTFVVAGPVEVKGTLRGRATGDAVTFDATYSIAANNCSGTMKLNGTFASRTTNLAEGPVNAMDSCVGALAGTFKVGR